MNDNTNNGRINKLLRGIDKLRAQATALRHEEGLRVRDGRGQNDTLFGYRSAQSSTAALGTLDSLQESLFTDPTLTFNGVDGEVSTEQNEEALAMRFHDTAGNIGLDVELVADAVLQMAESQLEVARAHYTEALRWAARS